MSLHYSASSAHIDGSCGMKPVNAKTMSRSQSAAAFGERSKLYRRPNNDRITTSPTQSRSGTLKPFKSERFDSRRGNLLHLPSRNLSLRRGYCFHHEKSPLKLTHIRQQTASCRFMDLHPPSLAVLPLPYVREGKPSSSCKRQSEEEDILFKVPLKKTEPPPNFHRLSRSQTRNVAVSRETEQKNSKLFSFKYPEEGVFRENIKKRVERLTDVLNPSGNLTLLLQRPAPPNNSECVLAASVDPSLLGSAIHTVRQLHQMLDAWSSIEASNSIQQTAESIIESVQGVVSAERVSLYILDSSRAYLRLISGVGDPDQLYGYLLRSGAGIAGKTAECGHSIYVADGYQDADFHRRLDTITGFKTRDLLCVPIFDKTTRSVQGVIQVLNLDKDKISVDHQRVLMELFADIASSALERSFQVETTKRKEIIIDNLLQVSQLVGRIDVQNPLQITNNIFDIIMNAAKHLVGAQHAALFVPDPIRTNMLVLKSCLSDDNAAIDASKGLLGYAFSHGQPINVIDAFNDPRFDAKTDLITGFAARELLIVPVKSPDGDTIALIQALNKSEESSLLSSRFTEEDMTLLKSVSLSVGTILNREAAARLSQQQKHTSHLNSKMSQLIQSMSDSPYEIDSVLEQAISILHEFVSVQAMNILLKDTVTGKYWTFPTSAREKEFADPYDCIATEVLESGRVLLINDCTHSDKFLHDRDAFWCKDQICSLLIIPMKDDFGECFGVVQLAKTTNSAGFGPEEVSIVESFAKQMTWLAAENGSRLTLARCSRDKELLSLMVDYLGAQPKSSVFTSAGDRFFVWPSEPNDDNSDPLRALMSFDFDVFAKETETLVELSVLMFERTGLHQLLGISLTNFRSFILDIQTNYRDNFYHNFIHAFSVYHVVFLFIMRSGLTHFLTNLEVLALFLASIAHDVDHHGHTNEFELRSNSELSKCYGTSSVLERHRLAVTLRHLKKHSVLESLDDDTTLKINKLISDAILATDISTHKEFLEAFERRFETMSLNRSSETDRSFAFQLIIRAADLSAQVFPTPIATKWEKLLSAELSMQARKQEDLGLEVAPFMRASSQVQHHSKLSAAVISLVTLPLWKQFVRIAPPMRDCLTRLHLNLKHYQDCQSN